MLAEWYGQWYGALACTPPALGNSRSSRPAFLSPGPLSLSLSHSLLLSLSLTRTLSFWLGGWLWGWGWLSGARPGAATVSAARPAPSESSDGELRRLAGGVWAALSSCRGRAVGTGPGRGGLPSRLVRRPGGSEAGSRGLGLGAAGDSASLPALSLRPHRPGPLNRPGRAQARRSEAPTRIPNRVSPIVIVVAELPSCAPSRACFAAGRVGPSCGPSWAALRAELYRPAWLVLARAEGRRSR